MIPVAPYEVVRLASGAVHLPGERIGFGRGLRVPNADKPDGDERVVKAAEFALRL
jgi:hypothetical protein